jgi:cohesin complex subunit SA-1/2
MDDEVQYRCAGYIQAEIDRYAEFLDNNADEDDNQKSDADELSEDENEGNPTTKNKEVKARKTAVRREGQISFSLLTFENSGLISFT